MMKTDELHYAILNELQLDSRISNAEIGRKIGLTAPAVAERIKRMQDEGIIKGFTTTIDFMQLGYQQKVLVAVQLPHVNINPFLKEAKKMEGITDIVHTTGEYCFFVSMVIKSSDELNLKLNEFGKFGKTTTFSVLSTPVDSGAICIIKPI
ncbi:Lrp/AsnC family transcriptional regulator [Pedobacter cryoconitis]|uniref:Lrp/AsnC family leucine-responsive transcriptional regulator n=1 Tax=Pedobacter cryoconitis TaxID=188932 RepID=A0A7X0J4Y1_9SPHI|nr:Lrp/AsnC family transcriptional regulator [Pedobacter cryoconitis]MBB6501193.1 Lrp/AsnC family leucine-responsive transcriptional regulator [Pedobacter cryoconitis]